MNRRATHKIIHDKLLKLAEGPYIPPQEPQTYPRAAVAADIDKYRLAPKKTWQLAEYEVDAKDQELLDIGATVGQKIVLALAHGEDEVLVVEPAELLGHGIDYSRLSKDPDIDTTPIEKLGPEREEFEER